jgi:hypothetical protein
MPPKFSSPAPPASTATSSTKGTDKTTLTTWRQILGIDDHALKALVKDDLLQDLWVFLEWRHVTKALAMLNQSPSLREVTDTIGSDFGLVVQASELFIRSDQICPRTVWAHTVIRIESHLAKIPTFRSTFDLYEARIEESFEFLKFLVKNMSNNRPFHSKRISKATGFCKQKVSGK